MALAPWFENTYFLPPQVTTFTASAPGGPGTAQCLVANTQRVAVIFSGIEGQIAYLYPYAPPAAPWVWGHILQDGSQNFSLWHQFWGPLVACDWYVNFNESVTLTITEIVLQRWPQSDQG